MFLMISIPIIVNFVIYALFYIAFRNHLSKRFKEIKDCLTRIEDKTNITK
jgi:uncharacterized membrane protein YciS (DUF1049 family)